MLVVADPSTSAEAHAFLSYKRGSLLWGLKRPDDAVEAYLECLSSVPDHLQANHDAAMILAFDLHRPVDAMPYARAALEALSATQDFDPALRGAMERMLLRIVEQGELEDR